MAVTGALPAAVAAAVLMIPASSIAAPPPFGGLAQLPDPQGCVSNFVPGCSPGTGLQQTHGVAVSPDGRSVYVTDEVLDAVAVFGRDPVSGALTQLAGTAGCVSQDGSGGSCADGRVLDLARAVAVSPDGANLYVGALSSHGVATFARDPGTGALTQLPGTAGCITQTGGDPGEPTTMCVDGEGLSSGAGGVAVSPDGRQVYAAGGASNDGEVAVLDRTPSTGALTQTVAGTEGCVSWDGEGGACAQVNGLNGANAVVFSPGEGRNLYVTASPVGDSITTLARDPATGDLTGAGCISQGGTGGCAMGSGLLDPTSVAMSPDGRNVYVAAGTSDALQIFTRDATGALAQSGCVSHTGGGCGAQGVPLDSVDHVVVSPDGAHVYSYAGTVSSSDGMAVFARDPTTGALTQLAAPNGCVTGNGTGGMCQTGKLVTAGRTIAVSPAGNSVYLNTVAVFAREVRPACSDGSASVPSRGTVTIPLQCSDANGDPLTREIAGAPAGGTLGAVNQAAGTVIYTANAGFTGNDAFAFRASDGTETSPAATISLTVTPALAVDTSGPLVTILGRTLRLSRRGRITVRLGCPAAETDGCRGAFDLRSARRVRAAQRRRRARILRVGRRSFTIAAGRTRRITLRASRRAVRLIRRRGRLRTRGTATARDRAGNNGTRRKVLTVKPVRRRRR